MSVMVVDVVGSRTMILVVLVGMGVGVVKVGGLGWGWGDVEVLTRGWTCLEVFYRDKMTLCEYFGEGGGVNGSEAEETSPSASWIRGRVGVGVGRGAVEGSRG
jgi:hypothetical protein